MNFFANTARFLSNEENKKLCSINKKVCQLIYCSYVLKSSKGLKIKDLKVYYIPLDWYSLLISTKQRLP